jgi:thymidylate kinase
MLIIVEGPDGVGKTTLVESIADYTSGVHVLHRGPPVGDPLVEYTFEDLDDYHWSGIWVCDRWHWGELVYGPYYRGRSELGWSGFRQVDDYLLSKGAVIAYLTEPVETLAERVAGRGDDYIKVDDLPYLVGAYELVAAESRVPVLCNPDFQQCIIAGGLFESCAKSRS